MKTRRNIWPFGTNQPLGPRSYVVRRRPAGRPASTKAAARAERESAAERKERTLSDPNLEKKLRAWYAKGGTLNEFLSANPGTFNNFFDESSEGKSKMYQGYRIWPVFGGWKTSLSALATFGSEREVKQFIDTYFARRNPAGTRGEFQRCVDAVASRGGAYDPRAVCAAMERRKYGQKELTRRSVAGRKAAKRKSRNPAAASAAVYEEFHGRPSSEEVTVIDKLHVHENLAGLGSLRKIVADCVDGKRHEIVGFGKAILCSNETKNQLFIRGGDQALDLAEFGISRPHELETIGVVVEIWYFTTKDHLGKEGGTAIYFHKAGETRTFSGRTKMAGYGPDLIYRVRDKLLEFSGGTYEIRAEGIDK